MVQWGKKLATKPDGLSSGPRTHLVERELTPLSSPLTSKYTSRHRHMYTHMCTHKYKKPVQATTTFMGLQWGSWVKVRAFHMLAMTTFPVSPTNLRQCGPFIQIGPPPDSKLF